MKKALLVLAAAITLTTIQSCKKIKGDGPVVTETRTTSSFKGIYSSISGDIHYTTGTRHSVEVRAQQNILDIIETRVVGNELKIEFTGNHSIGKHDHIDVYITSPDANNFSITGSGGLDATGSMHPNDMRLRVTGSGSMTIDDLDADNITATVSGSGDIIVNNGNAINEDITITGSGSVDCLNVKARDVNTNTQGSGSMKVYATDFLDVRIMGSGSVTYKGNPSINNNITGSGKVSRW